MLLTNVLGWHQFPHPPSPEAEPGRMSRFYFCPRREAASPSEAQRLALLQACFRQRPPAEAAAPQSHLHPWPSSTSGEMGRGKRGEMGRRKKGGMGDGPIGRPGPGPNSRCHRGQAAGGAAGPGVRSRPPRLPLLSLISFHQLLTCTRRLRSCCRPRLSAARLALSARAQKTRDAQRDCGARGRAPVRGRHAPALPFPASLPARAPSLPREGSRQALVSESPPPSCTLSSNTFIEHLLWASNKTAPLSPTYPQPLWSPQGIRGLLPVAVWPETAERGPRFGGLVCASRRTGR